MRGSTSSRLVVVVGGVMKAHAHPAQLLEAGHRARDLGAGDRQREIGGVVECGGEGVARR